MICVDDPPVVSASPVSQTVQYSDFIAAVTISASDNDSAGLSISASLPSDLSLSGSCTPAGSGTICTWTVDGRVLVPAGTYDLALIVSDATNDVPAPAQVVVEPEDATVSFDVGNPVGVLVDSPGGDSGPFSMTVFVQEMWPDQAAVLAAAGDISLAVVSMQLVPVGPGSAVSGTCVPDGVTGTGYDAVLTATCDFDDVPVNTYTAKATADTTGYYAGTGEDVLVVFDPSLGFTTGGFWCYWPGTEDPDNEYPGDRTNGGYVMKYNKRGTKVKGSLLLIRHMPDGSIYRLKSNSLFGLSIGEDDDGSPFGWASFSGKATYREPGWPDPLGNYTFITYVEDHGEPGVDVDHFWIKVLDRDGLLAPGLSMDEPAVDNTVTIDGGNIVVPHKTGRCELP